MGRDKPSNNTGSGGDAGRDGDDFAPRPSFMSRVGNGIGYQSGYSRLGTFLPLRQEDGDFMTFGDMRFLVDYAGRLGGSVGLGHRIYSEYLTAPSVPISTATCEIPIWRLSAKSAVASKPWGSGGTSAATSTSPSGCNRRGPTLLFLLRSDPGRQLHLFHRLKQTNQTMTA